MWRVCFGVDDSRYPLARQALLKCGAMPLGLAARSRALVGRRARRIALWAALALGCVTIAVLAAREANLLDRLLVYFPVRTIDATPSDLGLEYEDVYFETSDGVRLHGWYVPGAEDPSTGPFDKLRGASGRAPCVVWFHGNAGNIGHRVYNLALMRSRVGASVFLFDYRGYGRSEGSPSERGLYLDAEAAIEQAKLKCGVGDENIVLFGRSLGGSVAVEMAARRPFRAVVVESAFTSVKDMAKVTNRLIARFLPPFMVVKAKYDNLAKIPGARSPVLIVHGDRDTTVPHRMGLALYEAAPEPKEIHIVEGAGHDDVHVVGGEAYFEALRRFVRGPGR